MMPPAARVRLQSGASGRKGLTAGRARPPVAPPPTQFGFQPSPNVRRPRPRPGEEEMPELLRTIASRLRELVGNRRRAPRRKVRLAVFVSLLDATPGAPPAGGVAGHTRDASESGLGVVLPVIRLGGRYLVGGGVTLRLTLKLGEQNARLYGTPVRYE